MADTNAFAKLVPGFEFLQGLVKNAGQALPNVGQWIAPTLDPQELEKRIEQLRTVQFWLEQNARMLGATIQALEVQRMTLSTLKNMNLSMGELRDSMSLKPAAADTRSAAEPKSEASQAKSRSRASKAGTRSGPATPAGVVDPMQWWGALTKQFSELAATALKDNASDAAKNLAGHMVKQSFDAANETLKKAVAVPASVARTAAGVARTATTAAAGARARSARARKSKT